MSTNLFWQRPSPKWKLLPFSLRVALAKHYWGHDGSLGGQPVYLSYESDAAYLQGLADGGVDGAQTLLNVLGDSAIEICIME